MSGKSSKEKPRVLSGFCPDEQCKTKLFFPARERSIECTGCGQRHEQQALHQIETVENQDVALHNILKNVLLVNSKPKGTDAIKVLGLSNYHCKLLSPLLSKYGMDKTSGAAKLLKDLGQPESFDCGVLGDRSFLIDPEHIEVNGYGRDRTGSVKYLADTLKALSEVNDGEERLIPIHADGDGHCLVHAVSRALVGRELFWYPLRENLMNHFRNGLSSYAYQFSDFIDEQEWNDIIAECDPSYTPADGEPLGLRNIHILGLANVLRRPIILLDSGSGLQSSGDYSGVFLPATIPPEKCMSKDGKLNKPICIAWSSSSRNHYIPLVGIKGKPLPRVPRWLIPQAWGLPNDLVDKYIEFDSKDTCCIGGDRVLQDKYIQRLCKAMEGVFLDEYKVHPSLVADVHHYVYKSTGIVGVPPEEVIERTKNAVTDGRLFRCLTCDAITEQQIATDAVNKGGSLYQRSKYGKPQTNQVFSFSHGGLEYTYDPSEDNQEVALCECVWCHGRQMRHVKPDGKVQYLNGDRTTNIAPGTRCQCGFKHYWDGKEYDNRPERFPISMEWNGEVIREEVCWWQNENDTTMNSNVFEVAQQLVQKHFPGTFGSERLVQKVVDKILLQTAKSDSSEAASPEPMDTGWRDDVSSKIILAGPAKKSVHKEELNKCDSEKEVRKRISQNAAQQQKRKSTELSKLSEKSSQVPQKKSQPSPGATSPTTNSPKSSPRTPTEKKVRIQTSDGRQMMVSLDGGLTYKMLTEKICDELDIPVERQRIKHGFPPRELAPPSDTNESDVLPLVHGDRISVEIKPELEKPEPPPHLEVEEVDQQLASQEGGDSLDMSITSLALTAILHGRDLWSYVQGMPHLFSVGGLFYKQVERDIGLIDGKHCTLPNLPGKVFRFSSSDDRLELCLEPDGHFPIEPGIEEKVLKKNKIANLGHKLQPGDGGPEGNASGSHIAFSGQGHSLVPHADNIRMPKDIMPHSVHNKNRAVKLANFSTRSQPPEPIVEETGESSDGLVTDKAKTEADLHAHTDTRTTRKQQPSYKRIRPGFSVLDHESNSAVNNQGDLLKARAMSIEAVIEEEEEDSGPTNNSSVIEPGDLGGECHDAPEQGGPDMVFHDVMKQDDQEVAGHDAPEQDGLDMACDDVMKQGDQEVACHDAPEQDGLEVTHHDAPEQDGQDMACDDVIKQGDQEVACHDAPEQDGLDMPCDDVIKPGDREVACPGVYDGVMEREGTDKMHAEVTRNALDDSGCRTEDAGDIEMDC